jgi:hypothetical protein
VRLPFGAGSAIGGALSGKLASVVLRRRQPWRLATKPRQLATSCSTGCRARADRIEASMITPNDASCEITRKAPTSRTPDWNIMWKTRETPAKPPERSSTLTWESS